MATTHKYDYEVHPLAKLFPLLPDEEYQKLKADIKAHGLLEPIMLSGDSKMLLDGRNRLRACKELGINPTLHLMSWSFYKGISEADFIWSANVLRRHLTADQRAAIAHKWSDAERAAAKERQKHHAGTAPGKSKNTVGESAQSVRSRKAIAKKAHVSEHKVRQVETIAKKAPELLPKVESGEIKLKDAVATVAPPKVNATATTEQPTTKDTQQASSHKERMMMGLAMIRGSVKGLMQVDVACLVSSCTPAELEELVDETRGLSIDLSNFCLRVNQEMAWTTRRMANENS